MRMTVNMSEKPMVFAMQSRLVDAIGKGRLKHPIKTFLAIYRKPRPNANGKSTREFIVHEFLEWDYKLSAEGLIKIIKTYERQYYSQDREIENVEEAIQRVRLLTDVPRNKKTHERVTIEEISEQLNQR